MSRFFAITRRNPTFDSLMNISVKITILRDLRPCCVLEFTDVSGKLTAFIFRLENSLKMEAEAFPKIQ